MSALEDLVSDDGAGGPAHVRDASDRLGGGHRPQALLFSFFGGVVHGRAVPPIPSAVFLRLLQGLGVAEAAGRGTLARMTRKGLLQRTQVGRTAYYRLSPRAESLVGKADLRVHSPAPFEHPNEKWTLLSYSMPESRRALRHRVRATLTWAGFGSLRDGVWIAPGTVDVAKVLVGAGLEEVADLAVWFAASPLPGVPAEKFIRRAWPVDRIRERHERFIAAWWAGPNGGDPLSEITQLGADWLQVLRADPGLPARYLAADWPAAQSAAGYRRCYEALLPAAERRLNMELSVVAGEQLKPQPLTRGTATHSDEPPDMHKVARTATVFTAVRTQVARQTLGASVETS